MDPTTTGARLVLDILADEGVDTVFGYPGGAIMPLYDALHAHPVRHILTRHEQGASFAAGGYARSSGRVGVCCATSGPGATNLVTGLLDALMDSIPVVAITGQVRTTLMGTDGFQEADVTSITAAATKRSICVRSAAEIEPILRAAFRLARGPRPGPVLVDIPTDVLKAACRPLISRSPSEIRAATARGAASAGQAAFDDAIDLIRASKRPLAIAGGGIKSANAVALYREFCALLQLPHAATINGLGCAEFADRRFLGMMGMHGHKAANLAVNEADVILAFGMRFDDRVTGRTDRFARNAKIVHADIDASEIGKIIPVDVRLLGDVHVTLTQLLERLRTDTGPRFTAWAAEAAAFGGGLPCDRAPNGELSATSVLDRLFTLAPADAIMTTDVGQHQMWAAQRTTASDPRNFLTSGGLGAMGFGLPAAIGAQFAHPDRAVVAIVGDGGFQMSLPELATIKRYELPVKVLVIDNRRLGMVRQWQELFYEKRYSATDLSDNPDFVAIAHGFGIRAEVVHAERDLAAALERFFRAREATLLHCACFPMENVWPLVPPGAANVEAIEARPT